MYSALDSSGKTTTIGRRTEFDVLKASHRFLRDDDEKDLSWDEQVAKKYYSSLFREYAVCDLKHYKSGNFSLRWRTESEVLSGAGEETCGNTRCTHHEPSKALPQPPLKTIELPFAYEEHGERKSALVKVVLCDRCFKKLMWKREKDKQLARVAQDVEEPEVAGADSKQREVESAVSEASTSATRGDNAGDESRPDIGKHEEKRQAKRSQREHHSSSPFNPSRQDVNASRQTHRTKGDESENHEGSRRIKRSRRDSRSRSPGD